MTTEDTRPESLLAHLIELRARLLRGAIGLLLVFLALLPFAADLFNLLAQPLLATLPVGGKLLPQDATSGFSAVIKLAFFGALFISMPWLIYQAWAFVAPGLYRNEKKLALPLLASAVCLFYAGCAFAFFLVVPGVFIFLANFTPESVGVNSDPNKYLDLIGVIFLAFGASFEVPVAVVVLVLIGLVTPEQLREARGYVIVGIFIVAAIITPPDAVSQLMLAIPMMILYEIGLVAARLVARRPRPTTDSP